MGIAYIYHFAYKLIEYKLVLEYLNLGSKHSQMFYTLSELSVGIYFHAMCDSIVHDVYIYIYIYTHLLTLPSVIVTVYVI